MEILRLAKRPLHYKKITELAIERKMLSHVGKTPELTMSSRLATVVKKDKNKLQLIKIKPGIFGLKTFTKEALAKAEQDEAKIEIPELDVSVADANQGVMTLISTDVYQPEEDDHISIFAVRTPVVSEAAPAEAEGTAPDHDDRRKRKKSRFRDGRSAAESEPETQTALSKPTATSTHGDTFIPQVHKPKRKLYQGIDMSREPEQGDVLGRDLADAVFTILQQNSMRPTSYVEVAGALVSKGRLSGEPSTLVPTIAAAIRADVSRRKGDRRQRFRLVDGQLTLAEWYLPREATRFEKEAQKLAERQRETVHKAFTRKLGELPAAGFVEMMATWLNAEGIASLRGVRRPHSSANEIHLAGIRRKGFDELRVAVVLVRDGKEVMRDKVTELRGSLHHYGDASAAWVVTLGYVHKDAREEAAISGLTPVTIFDARDLAEAMEQAGVGLKAQVIPVSTMDFDLLDQMRGHSEKPQEARGQEGESQQRGGDRERGDGQRTEGQRGDTQRNHPRNEHPKREEQRGEQKKADGATSESAESADERKKKRRRRKRRRDETGAVGAAGSPGAEGEEFVDDEEGDFEDDELTTEVDGNETTAAAAPVHEGRAHEGRAHEASANEDKVESASSEAPADANAPESQNQ